MIERNTKVIRAFKNAICYKVPTIMSTTGNAFGIGYTLTEYTAAVGTTVSALLAAN